MIMQQNPLFAMLCRAKQYPYNLRYYQCQTIWFLLGQGQRL